MLCRTGFNSKRIRFTRAVKKQQGLVGYWPLNEVSGNATDYSPQNIVGTATNVTIGQAGTIGRGYKFNGTNSTIDIAASTVHNQGSIMAYMCLFQLNTPHANGSAEKELLKRDPPYIFDLHNNGLIEFALHNGVSYSALFSNKSSWNANTWYMPILQNGNNGSMQIFINGVQDNIQGSLAIGTSSTVMHLFNQDGAGGADFPGTVQHVALYTSPGINGNQARKLAHLAGLI